MDHLNIRVPLDLEEDGDGDTFPYVDREVQDSPFLEANKCTSSLANVSFIDTRTHQQYDLPFLTASLTLIAS